MHFEFFKENITKITNIPLPGLQEQLRMAPPGRSKMIQQYQQRMQSSKKAAVLALLYPDREQQMQLVFILRQKYSGVHSQQVSFPGGKNDTTDPDLLYTALRETHEEIGVSSNTIDVLRPLSHLFIPPSNFYVHPFLGVSKQTLDFTKEEKEVSEIIEVPLKEILSDDSEGVFEVNTSLDQTMEVPAFYLKKHIVWGATAMILAEIKALIKTL
jgi:8-oxo-dGTP pyrophosphatase MutT (NUDIX family)